MANPREFRFNLDVSFHASPGDDEDMLSDILDGLSFAGAEAEVSPYSTNPQCEECECCGELVWDDEMEACGNCQASICGSCMVNYNGMCVSCDTDPDSEPVD